MPLSGSTIYALILGFVLIGAAVIFAPFPGITNIVAHISWAFAIAKKMSKETT
jgi:hypothetical protein